MSNTLLSIVIPIKNEELILWETISILSEKFDQIIGKQLWNFILVNNNSTDNTKSIIEKICTRWPLSKSVFEVKKGYGAALRTGLDYVDTPYALIIDVEQWDIPFIIWAWKNREKYDLFMGSKRADSTISKQPFYRWLLSWGLNTLLRFLFNFRGTDTHGQKLINLKHMETVVKSCMMGRSLYDTEIVLRACRGGYSIAEAAVAFSEKRPTRNFMLEKIIWNLLGMVKLYRIMLQIPFKTPAVYRRFLREDILEVTGGN